MSTHDLDVLLSLPPAPVAAAERLDHSALPVVTIKPIGGSPRPLRVEGNPRFSAARGVGYEQASIPVAYEDMEATDLQGADLHIHGAGWRGVVVKRPVPGEPLKVMGRGMWAGGLREVSSLYADNRLHAWNEWRDDEYGAGIIRPALTPSGTAWWLGLTLGEAPYVPRFWRDATYRGDGISDPMATSSGLWLGLTKGTPARGQAGVEFYDTENGISSARIVWSKVSNTSFGLIVYRGDSEGTITATPYSNTGTGTTTNITLPAGTVWLAIALNAPSEYTPATAGLGINISELQVNGTSVWYKRSGISYYDPRGITNLRFTWAKPATSAYGLTVYRGTAQGVIAGTAYALNTGTGTPVSLSMPSGTVWVAIALATNAWRWPNAAAQGISVHSLMVNGRGLTNVTTESAALDILTRDIDAPYALDATRVISDHIPMSLEPLMFEATTVNEKMGLLMERAPIEYGWYSEIVDKNDANAYPHITDREDEPRYVVHLDRAESNDIELASLDDMTSGTRVFYERPDGSSAAVDVLDYDEDHPLVALGIKRFGHISVTAAAELDAIIMGMVANEDMGRQRVRGSVVTRELLTMTGTQADRYQVRPGEMVRLYGPGLTVDARILRLTWEGDLTTLEFDTGGYRLDALLANLAAKR